MGTVLRTACDTDIYTVDQFDLIMKGPTTPIISTLYLRSIEPIIINRIFVYSVCDCLYRYKWYIF